MRMPSTWPRILYGNRGRTSLQSCATRRRAESPTTRRTDSSGATEVKAEYPRLRIGHFAAPRQTRPQSGRTDRTWLRDDYGCVTTCSRSKACHQFVAMDVLHSDTVAYRRRPDAPVGGREFSPIEHTVQDSASRR